MNLNNFKNIGVLFLLIFTTFLCQSCLVSRCERPQITGYIYDKNTNSPVTNCKVGEALTNEMGYFNLKEKRYSQFTFFGYEAPPIAVNETVFKDGYEKETITLYNSFGGGLRKGTIHHADTIYLKKAVNPIP
ncbi:hypothetical protein [Flavobacterium poyangense]|uniref:hypothetical protein n=1 Tax=Flavobacterium poyangense TaxID=2204302 RepID=UPI001FB98798|nr:hypothetical protein [Flavobacterium sp. JXAS1]